MQQLKAIADHLIPPPDYNEALYKDGNTADIITQVLTSYRNRKEQLSRLAPYIQAANLVDTCRVIWQLVKHNIAYVVDPPGRQWVRTPARLWADKQGDCKSYSVFIASCLYNLGIKGCFRFVTFDYLKDREGNYITDKSGNRIIGPPTHVYVVVKIAGREIIIDAVMPAFNQEKPFLKKWDYNMTRISELSGIPGQPQQISGGLSTALNKGKRREVLNHALPGLAMAGMYIFIPGFGNTYAKEVKPMLATPDDLWSSLPAVVKEKTRKAADSFWDFGDWADIKVENEVFPKLKQIISAQLGMDPAQWWRNALAARTGNITGIGAFDPATIMAVAQKAGKVLETIGKVFSGIKSALGGLFGGSDIKWNRGDPSTWAPDVSDWNGYAVNPLMFIPTAASVGEPALPVTYIPPATTIPQPTYRPNQPTTTQPTGTPTPYTPPAEMKDNTMLYVGGALLLLLVMKK